jgi:fructose-1,6-bisphosphatase/inositol monophosphatase family enzyme
VTGTARAAFGLTLCAALVAGAGVAHAVPWNQADRNRDGVVTWEEARVAFHGLARNLNLMIKAARKAGRSLVKDFREVENLQVSTKGPGDFVSKADREAERLIKEELLGGRPTYGWIGEETGVTPGADPTRRWIVDPLDGTTNFLHGMPHWAVSIALEHKGEIVSAVVYDPAKDEMFWAEKGAGCWLNDNRRLRVSGRRAMPEAVFATGVPFGAKSTLPATLAGSGAADAGLRRACGAGGRRRWTWPMSRRAGSTAIGSVSCPALGRGGGAPGRSADARGRARRRSNRACRRCGRPR